MVYWGLFMVLQVLKKNWFWWPVGFVFFYVLGPIPPLVLILSLVSSCELGALCLKAKVSYRKISYLDLVSTGFVGVALYSLIFFLASMTGYANFPITAFILAIPICLSMYLSGARSVFDRYRLSLNPVSRLGYASASILFVLLVHLLYVGLPEVSHDALATHLYVPLHVKAFASFHHDPSYLVWSNIPLGASWYFVPFAILEGEMSVRLANWFCLAGIAVILVGAVQRLKSSNQNLGFLAVAALLSTPLLHMQSGNLFADLYWYLFMLLLFTPFILFEEQSPRARFLMFTFFILGFVNAKSISLVMGPFVAVGFFYLLHKAKKQLLKRDLLMVSVLILGIFSPFINAFLRTGNPLFPFYNHIFKSDLFYSHVPFNNSLFNAPLGFRTLYDLSVHSARYIEGGDGLFGFFPLLIFPLSLLLFLQPKVSRLYRVMLVSCIFFFCFVYLKQSYLRYLYIVFPPLLAILFWEIKGFIVSKRNQIVLGAILCGMIFTHINLFASSFWFHSEPIFRLLRNRDQFKEAYSPYRVLLERLGQKSWTFDESLLLLGMPTLAGGTGRIVPLSWYSHGIVVEIFNAKSEVELRNVFDKYNFKYVLVDDHHEKIFTKERSKLMKYIASEFELYDKIHDARILVRKK